MPLSLRAVLRGLGLVSGLFEYLQAALCHGSCPVKGVQSFCLPQGAIFIIIDLVSSGDINEGRRWGRR